MRRLLVLYGLAMTSVVVVAFLVPLGLLARSLAEERALSAGRQDAQSVAVFAGGATQDAARLQAAVLAVNGAQRRTTVFLPDGTTVGAPVAASPAIDLAQLGRALTARTDGGVQVDSQWIINEIMQSTMGGAQGMADAKALSGETGAAVGVAMTASEAARAPLETINKKGVDLKDAIAGVKHYAGMDFGYNANLGPHGLDDDLNAPEVRGPEANGFDPVQIETTFGLYTSLSRCASEFVVAAAAAGSAVGDPHVLGLEKDYAQYIAQMASRWATMAQNLRGRMDSVMYGKGHGTIGSGEDKEKRTALRTEVLEHVNTWSQFYGRTYTAAEQPAQAHAG